MTKQKIKNPLAALKKDVLVAFAELQKELNSYQKDLKLDIAHAVKAKDFQSAAGYQSCLDETENELDDLVLLHRRVEELFDQYAKIVSTPVVPKKSGK